MIRSLSLLLATVCLLVAPRPASARQADPPAADPRATAAISGQVVSGKTGQPLQDATVRIVSFEVMRAARSARTDAEGRFEFRDLLPGRYQLEARATGHLTLSFGQRRPVEAERPIDLAADVHFADANLTLPATSAISGLVVDEFGDPAPNIAVMISTAVYIAGQRRMLPSGSPVRTDDRGQFRIENVAPGEYYVLGLTGAFAGADGGSADTGGFAPTFFPGATSADEARQVVVGVGEEVGGVSFAMIPGVTADLAGRVVDGTDAAIASATIIMVPSDRSRTGVLMIARAVTGEDGGFTFRNVPPGEFTLQAFARGARGNLGSGPFGHQIIQMEGEPLEDVKVVVPPARSARGRVVFEPADATRPTPREVRISLAPTDFDSSPVMGGPPVHTMNDDYTFEVTPMNGQRLVRADVSSAVWRLKQVTVNGRDVTDTPLDFRTEDVDDIVVTLSNRTGTLTGTVAEVDGSPSMTYAVLIFSAEPRHWTTASRYSQIATGNQNGAFRATGLPPADYLAVALPAVSRMNWEDPEYLEALRPLATRVTIGDGGTANVRLTIVRR